MSGHNAAYAEPREREDIVALLSRDSVEAPLSRDAHLDKPTASEPTTAGAASAPGLEGRQCGNEWRDQGESPQPNCPGLEIEVARLRETLLDALDHVDAVDEAKDKGRFALRGAVENLVRALRADPRAMANHLARTAEAVFPKSRAA